MSWEVKSLDDLCDEITVGFVGSMASEYVECGIPFLRSLNIEPFKLNLNKSQLKFINEDFHLKIKKSKLYGGDLAIVRTGTPGTCCVIPYDFGEVNCSDLVIARPKKGVNSQFLCYFINSPLGMGSVGGSLVGVAQKHFNVSVAKRMQIPIPDYPTQNRIASILSAYDDLIENNLKRIKLLEETAQNIYKEWFVNFRFPNYEHTAFDAESGLPVGWEFDVIGNQLLTIKRNGKLKTDDYDLVGKYPIIDQGNGFIAGYTNNEEIVQETHLPVVVFGDHTRRVKFVNFPFVSGADGTQLMFPKNENLLPAYFYLSIKNIDLSNYAYARHYKFMKEQQIIIPDEKTLSAFNTKVYPLLEQTIHLFNYNQKLKEARDILLPRLMNRTIEV